MKAFVASTLTATHLIAAALLAALAPVGMTQTTSVGAASAPGQAGAIANEQTTAVVASVDQASREVTLREADGTLLGFIAGPDVRNLAQVKVGDVVTLSHTTALVLELKKNSGGIRERVETEGGMRAAPGQMPAGIVAREVRVVAA